MSMRKENDNKINSVVKQIEESNALRLLIGLWIILAIVSKLRF